MAVESFRNSYRRYLFPSIAFASVPTHQHKVEQRKRRRLSFLGFFKNSSTHQRVDYVLFRDHNSQLIRFCKKRLQKEQENVNESTRFKCAWVSVDSVLSLIILRRVHIVLFASEGVFRNLMVRDFSEILSKDDGYGDG